ncbi:hypothetical protein [Pseudomonas floridensis]|uniref:hypothetical protein n=1 Tax=Pseudomonas floridensis TaxID=1958950 RepID=UPI0012FF872D|nr:hypothetical protein [Pseudomonas floridensis]
MKDAVITTSITIPSPLSPPATPKRFFIKMYIELPTGVSKARLEPARTAVKLNQARSIDLIKLLSVGT